MLAAPEKALSVRDCSGQQQAAICRMLTSRSAICVLQCATLGPPSEPGELRRQHGKRTLSKDYIMF